MKISISDIKSFYPDGFAEQIYINSSKFRLTNEGQDIVIFQTPQKFKVKGDETWRTRKVQTVFYDKFQLSFITTESTNLDLLRVANNVIITLDSGEIHDAELLDIPTYEKLQNSEFKRVTLIYRDLNSKETINHLNANSLTDGIAKFHPGITNIYSPIYCKFDVSEYDRQENNDNYVQSVSAEIAFKQIKFYAYVSEGALFNIKQGVNAEEVAASDVYIEFNGTTYTALEVPEIEEIEDDFEDLRGIIVTLSYEKILNYPYV